MHWLRMDERNVPTWDGVGFPRHGEGRIEGGGSINEATGLAVYTTSCNYDRQSHHDHKHSCPKFNQVRDRPGSPCVNLQN